MNRFNGQTALITGGASGIGHATVERLAAEGANVAIADYNLEEAEKLAKQLQIKGYNVRAIYYNATDMNSGTEAVTKTVDWSGSIDCLINNVGGSDLKRDLDIKNLDMDYFDDVFHLNLKIMRLKKNI